MKLKITEKKKSSCGNYNFSIYEHSLSFEELDNYILDILYDEVKLNYLFQKDQSFSKKDRVRQLQRFIETSFINREEEVTDKEINQFIAYNKNETYYSFFAEA